MLQSWIIVIRNFTVDLMSKLFVIGTSQNFGLCLRSKYDCACVTNCWILLPSLLANVTEWRAPGLVFCERIIVLSPEHVCCNTACCVLGNLGRMMLDQRYISLSICLTQEFLILLRAWDRSITLKSKFYHEWLHLLGMQLPEPYFCTQRHKINHLQQNPREA